MDNLPDKSIKVVPVKRIGGTFLPAGHDGDFMFTGCKLSLVVPFDKAKGRLVDPLNDEERDILEQKLAMKKGELSIYRKGKDNFWHSFRVELDKEGIVLNLNEPMDYIKYKVLLTTPQIAESWEKRFARGEIKFAIVDGEYEVKEHAKAADYKRKAYVFLDSIEGNREKMIDVLTVYGKRPSKDASKDFLITAIDDIISNPKTIAKFMEIVEDKNFEKRLFIEKCLEAGAVLKMKSKYSLPGGDVIGNSIDEAIEYINNKKNNEIYATLKAQVEAFKK
jgi:hypothetical protein